MLQRGHLRLIDKCGLYMYTFFFLSKFSWCGLYSGALNSPEITIHTYRQHILCQWPHWGNGTWKVSWPLDRHKGRRQWHKQNLFQFKKTITFLNLTHSCFLLLYPTEPVRASASVSVPCHCFDGPLFQNSSSPENVPNGPKPHLWLALPLSATLTQ